MDVEKAKATLIRAKASFRLTATIPTNQSSTDFDIVFETEEEAKKFLAALYSITGNRMIRKIFFDKRWDMRLFHQTPSRLAGKFNFCFSQIN